MKWAEKSPPISKGFEAGPEHTETVVNFTLGHKDALQASGTVAGTAKGLTPTAPPVGTAAGEVAGAEPERGRPAQNGSQPARHPCCSRASGRRLPLVS